jgi:hypothetical protein
MDIETWHGDMAWRNGHGDMAWRHGHGDMARRHGHGDIEFQTESGSPSYFP